MKSFFQRRYVRIIATILLVPALSQCSRDTGDISQLSNYDLADRAYRCGGKFKPAPGAAISCTNIERECKKRSKDKGYPVC